MYENILSSEAVGSAIPLDDRLNALLSITGRMDGYLYRCRNDALYTMIYISDGILAVTGYPSTDFIFNQKRNYVSVVHPDDLAGAVSAVNSALEKRRNWNIDYRIVPKFGPPVWVREIGGGVWDDFGELVFLEGFIIDISDRKHIEDLNTELVNNLKLANEKLSVQKHQLELAKLQSDHSAHHDQLTGLPNRRAFHHHLNAIIDRNQSLNQAVVLMFIDLDNFKQVNDTLGHDAGDNLLKKVAIRLQGQLRSTDFVARLGGDEFAFVLSCDQDAASQDAMKVAQRILERLRIEVPAPRGTVSVGCTIGLAVYPTEASGLPDLLALADRLMYNGKRSGRSRIVTLVK